MRRVIATVATVGVRFRKVPSLTRVQQVYQSSLLLSQQSQHNTDLDLT